ncbi:MAG: hypothetical protein FWH01_15220 [Oscillospiraceae bacterium]|nr:hypothetical protein [Oscillospiraceae bacterium]
MALSVADANAGASAGANIGTNADANNLWQAWRGFLASGYQRYIANILVAVTALIVMLLFCASARMTNII